LIYSQPGPLEPVDQADLIDGVPLLEVQELNLDDPDNPVIGCALNRVIVLTQTCDLTQRKANRITIARVFDAEELIARGMAKAADIRGPIRSSRVWGLYFLPASRPPGLAEMVIDLRQIHCIPLDVLELLCKAGKRKACLQSPYREHLSKHFGDSYSRIGLPMPYETD